MALFVDRKTRAWVAWTPTGYYMASPGGEDLIGWHVNRGWNQAADFFPASRFRDRFNRPDIVQLVLATLDEDEAIKQANEAARRKEDTTAADRASAAESSASASPADGAHVQNGTVTLDYAVRSPSGQAVDRIDRPHQRSAREGIRPADPDRYRPTPRPQAPSRSRSPSTSAEVGSDRLERRSRQPGRARENHLGRRAGSHPQALCPGGRRERLRRSGHDAQICSQGRRRLRHGAGGAEGRSITPTYETRVLTDREVTRASVIEGLEWLEKMATNPNDVSVLFLAGHGGPTRSRPIGSTPSDVQRRRRAGQGRVAGRTAQIAARPAGQGPLVSRYLPRRGGGETADRST